MVLPDLLLQLRFRLEGDPQRKRRAPGTVTIPVFSSSSRHLSSGQLVKETSHEKLKAANRKRSSTSTPQDKSPFAIETDPLLVQAPHLIRILTLRTGSLQQRSPF